MRYYVGSPIDTIKKNTTFETRCAAEGEVLFTDLTIAILYTYDDQDNIIKIEDITEMVNLLRDRIQKVTNELQGQLNKAMNEAFYGDNQDNSLGLASLLHKNKT